MRSGAAEVWWARFFRTLHRRDFFSFSNVQSSALTDADSSDVTWSSSSSDFTQPQKVLYNFFLHMQSCSPTPVNRLWFFNLSIYYSLQLKLWLLPCQHHCLHQSEWGSEFRKMFSSSQFHKGWYILCFIYMNELLYLFSSKLHCC